MTDEGPHPNNKTGHIEWEILPFNVACFKLFGCFPSSGPGCARATFPVGEGYLRRGLHTWGLSFVFRCPLHTREATTGCVGDSVLITDLLVLDGLVGDEAISIQILPVHIQGGDLVVVVGGVVIDALGHVAAAGIQGDLVLVFR